MDEVRGLVEAELSALLGQLVDCPVLPGDGEVDRPDEYVSVVGGDADARGSGMHLLDLEIRVVGPVDAPEAVEASRRRLRTICAWLDAADCPFRGYESTALVVPGFMVTAQTGEKGARSRADIVHLKVGCAAL